MNEEQKETRDITIQIIEPFFQELSQFIMHPDQHLEVFESAKRCALLAMDEREIALKVYGEESHELQNMDSEWRYLDFLRTEIVNLRFEDFLDQEVYL